MSDLSRSLLSELFQIACLEVHAAKTAESIDAIGRFNTESTGAHFDDDGE